MTTKFYCTHCTSMVDESRGIEPLETYRFGSIAELNIHIEIALRIYAGDDDDYHLVVKTHEDENRTHVIIVLCDDVNLIDSIMTSGFVAMMTSICEYLILGF